MADKIRGITVELNGDTSGLTKSLKSANQEIKSTQSQLKDVEKLLKLDPTNTELLRQKQKLLADAVDETSEKLETLRQAESKLKESGVDENSSQFMALRREIIATESSMQSYKDEMNDAGDEAEDSTEKMTTGANKVKVAWVAVAAAVAAVGKALVSTVTDSASTADDLLTLATQTGLTTEKLQELTYASELVDVSVDTLTNSMAKNIRSMTTAAKGTGDAYDAYKKLGVSIIDSNGKLRDSETVYFELIEALGKVEDETERDSLAMTLLGKSAQDINPLIAAGSSRLAELAAEAHEVGYVMSEETLSAFGALDDSIQRLKNNAQALSQTFAETVLPALQGTADTGVNLLSEFTQIVEDAEGNIGEIIVGIVNRITDYLPAIIDSVIEIVWQITDALIDALPEMIPKIVDAICDVIDKLQSAQFLAKLTISVLKLVWAVIKSVAISLPRLLSSLYSWGNVDSYGSSEIPAFANGGTLTSGGTAIVGEAGPEILTNVGGKAIVTPISSGSSAALGTIGESTINNQITIEFSGSLAQLGQVLQPYISAESHRIGAN